MEKKWTWEIPGGKQSRETDSVWDINSERCRKRDTFGSNEFQLYCFQGAGDGLDGGFFPDGSDGKGICLHAGDLGLIPGSGRSLEKGMATHPRIIAWRIPVDRGASGLQPMGSQRVEHGRATALLLSQEYKCPNDQEDAFTDLEP